MNAIKILVLGSILVAAGCAATARQSIACSPRSGGTEVVASEGAVAYGDRCECTVNVEDAERDDCQLVGGGQISRADPR